MKKNMNDLLKSNCIPDELANALTEAEERFHGIFGRKPGSGDKIYFEQYLLSHGEHEREMRRTGERANVSPRVLYCTQRTGYVISESRKHLFPETFLAEWEQAAIEYDTLVEECIDPFIFLDFESPSEYELFIGTKKILDDSIIILGSLIDKNQIKLDSTEKFVILYYVSRAFNSLKVLRGICNERPTRDAVGLTRPVYECLLRVRFIHSKPGAAETFLKQAQAGTRSRLNFKEMAKASGDVSDVTLYDELYPFLSSITHADLSDMTLFFSESDGYFHQGHADNVIEPILIAIILSIFLLTELSYSPILNRLSRRDATFFCKQTAGKLLKFEKDWAIKLMPALPECRHRIEILARKSKK